MRAFELHALDYLVKPYREDRLRQAIGRARALLNRRELGPFRQRAGRWAAHGRARPATAAARPLLTPRGLGPFRQRVGAWVTSQPAYPSRVRVEDKDRIRF